MDTADKLDDMDRQIRVKKDIVESLRKDMALYNELMFNHQRDILKEIYKLEEDMQKLQSQNADRYNGGGEI